MGISTAIATIGKGAVGAVGKAAPSVAPKAFKPTGTMIGAGIGAVGGGIGGAVTAPTDPQTGKKRGVLGRALGGAVMGAGLGAGIGKGVSMHRAGNLNMNTLRGGLDKMKARAGQVVDDIGAKVAPSPLKGNQFGGMSPAEAKKAFRQRALQAHPDRGGDPEVFKRLNDEWAAFKGHHKMSSVDDLIFHFFFDEMNKLAANRRSGPLRVPGIANGKTPRGLADPTPAQAGNLAKFQKAGPGKAMVTGTSTSASNPGSLISSGTTTQVGTPSPKPVM